jgi:hypothetical protein
MGTISRATLGSSPAQAPQVPVQAPSVAATKLMIFGGEGHKTYLGCLDCSEYASDSVFNTYGEHGSSYAVDSIANHYGQFGSAYAAYSACNPYSSDPPVVVDGSGRFYGRLTLNVYTAERFNNERINAWLPRSAIDPVRGRDGRLLLRPGSVPSASNHDGVGTLWVHRTHPKVFLDRGECPV